MQGIIQAIVVISLLVSMYVEPAVSAESRRCSIKQIVGSVKIRRGTSTTWSDARPKTPLKESDAVRTFMESEAELETSEGTIIKVGENTTIELAKLYGDADKQATSVKILNGAVLANVKKLVSTSSTFDFETPTATAAIRGTVVGFEVSKEMTKVKVYEGKVWVAPQGAKKGIEIQPNEMGVVKKGANQVSVEKLDSKSPVVLSVVPADTSAKNDSLQVQPLIPDSSTIGSDSTINGGGAPSADTAGQSLNMAPLSPLQLMVASPTDGTLFPPKASIPVSGTVTLAGAVVTVNGKGVSVASSGAFKTLLTAPDNSGDFEIVIAAEHQGGGKSIVRKVKLQQLKLQFSVVSPFDGQEFKKPLVAVSGSVTPGAEVTVQSIKLPVTGSGTFTGQIPIANETGTYTLEFQAVVEGASQIITRKISYKPEYRFIMTSPADRQTITTTMFPVKGEVLPVNAEVSVMGRQLPVSASGQFNGVITIPDEEGEVVLEFEVNAPGITKTEIRKVTYTRPPDINRPQLSVSVAKGCWSITVFDRTVDEEITLYSEIDGVKESRVMRPNESTCIPFESGIHDYSVYAEDKSGNSSSTEELKSYPFLAGANWLIKMRKPAGNIAIDLPPASPAGEQAIYPLELTIEKLPDDNMNLIREIIITNRTNGKKVYVRTFTDNFISADIEIVRNKVNVIQIDANDVNNVIKSQSVQIQVR